MTQCAGCAASPEEVEQPEFHGRALWIAHAGGVKSGIGRGAMHQGYRINWVCVTTPQIFPASDLTTVCHTIVVRPR